MRALSLLVIRRLCLRPTTPRLTPWPTRPVCASLSWPNSERFCCIITRTDHQLAVAWWTAAQLLRTTGQRDLSTSGRLRQPRCVASIDALVAPSEAPTVVAMNTPSLRTSGTATIYRERVARLVAMSDVEFAELDPAAAEPLLVAAFALVTRVDGFAKEPS